MFLQTKLAKKVKITVDFIFEVRPTVTYRISQNLEQGLLLFWEFTGQLFIMLAKHFDVLS